MGVWELNAPVSATSASTVAGGGAGSAANVASLLANGLAWQAAGAMPAAEPPGALLHGETCQTLTSKNGKGMAERSNSWGSHQAPTRGLCRHRGEKTNGRFGGRRLPRRGGSRRQAPRGRDPHRRGGDGMPTGSPPGWGRPSVDA